MCRLSIVVPSIGSQEQFEDTLASVLQHRPEACEILVPHSGPYGDPYDLASEVRFVEVAPQACLAALLNAGCHRAKGIVLHVVLPGVTVAEGWTAMAADAFADPAVSAVASLVINAVRPDRVAVAGLRLTPGGRRVPHGAGFRVEQIARLQRGRIDSPWLAASFFRGSVFHALGGFGLRTQPSWLDMELSLRLQRLGYHTRLVGESRVFSGIPVAEGRAGFLAGRDAERIFWSAAGTRGIAGRLLPHGLMVCGSLLRQFPRPSAWAGLLGRLAALLDVPGRRSERRLLQQAEEILENFAEGGGEGRHHIVGTAADHRRAA